MQVSATLINHLPTLRSSLSGPARRDTMYRKPELYYKYLLASHEQGRNIMLRYRGLAANDACR